jgi:YidC/Oxa1 family membrane protein insertase
MIWLHGFIPNYGVVIIIISVLAKILFYPLTRSSVRSMKAMQKLAPRMQEIKEKHKGDPQRMQAETMALYKEHKVNPLGGCLPILVQMPVFIALYSVLANSITLRQASFVGWINDLSVPDTIAVIAGFGIHVLPVLMFLTTLLQQRLTPVTDPRQKMIGYMMPVVMLFIFYSFPAGLNLYWTVTNALQVGQQWWIHREDAPRAAA